MSAHFRRVSRPWAVLVPAVFVLSCTVVAFAALAEKRSQAERAAERRLMSLGASCTGFKTKCWWFPIRDEFHVTGIQVVGHGYEANKFRDCHIPLVSILPEITQLELVRTEISDQGLREIGKLGKLEDLSLVTFPANSVCWGDIEVPDSLTAAGLGPLAGLPKLRRLRIEGYYISDDGFNVIGASRRLDSLQIANTSVSNSALRALGGMRQLKCLYLENVTAPEGSVANLIDKLDGLEELSLVGTQFPRDRSSALNRLRKLRKLWLGDGALTGDSANAVLSLPNIVTFVEGGHIFRSNVGGTR
jgi:hypothetical protein